jgi:hypothetical protein
MFLKTCFSFFSAHNPLQEPYFRGKGSVSLTPKYGSDLLIYVANMK